MGQVYNHVYLYPIVLGRLYILYFAFSGLAECPIGL